MLLLLLFLGLAHSPPMLINTLWVDRLAGPRDPVCCCFFGMDGQGMTIDAASSFKSTLELFRYRDDGARLRYRFPHDEREAASDYRIEPVNDPRFEARLTLSADPLHGGRSHVYYSLKPQPRGSRGPSASAANAPGWPWRWSRR